MDEMDGGNYYIFIFHRREAIDTVSKSGKSGLGYLKIRRHVAEVPSRTVRGRLGSET